MGGNANGKGGGMDTATSLLGLRSDEASALLLVFLRGDF